MRLNEKGTELDIKILKEAKGKEAKVYTHYLRNNSNNKIKMNI